jgi:hypothetical protein
MRLSSPGGSGRTIKQEGGHKNPWKLAKETLRRASQRGRGKGQVDHRTDFYLMLSQSVGERH